jgi:PAS domain-containing protein
MLDTPRSLRTTLLRVSAPLLVITFVIEVGVMFLLPVLFTKRLSAWTEASIDACLLVLILSPILWWLIVRPLQRKHEESESRLSDLVAEQSRILESFFKHTQTCLVFLDRNFNFIHVNDAYAKACRREVSEFAGRNHFELYPSDELKAEFERVVHEERAQAGRGVPKNAPEPGRFRSVRPRCGPRGRFREPEEWAMDKSGPRGGLRCITVPTGRPKWKSRLIPLRSSQ